ncbi:stage II sporulation protein M [Maricaulis maris]|uniref:Putative membrane protein SpoIIM required for sporulation n=1 Tax=Maricaulis maris TaxID=74318 RepID=A0A495D3A3_9PROT|nr:stage II sporulation protein M [Maricaulis maris]RKQ96236.1 putative membrane protein SpoIIM required for sporulation [Maricaulis maris]
MSEVQPIRSTRFRAEREADWRALEVLIKRVESRGSHRLSFDESRALAELYRKAATSLSVARDISLDKNLLIYLESLVARAFLSVYAPQDSLSGVVGRFFGGSASAAVRRSGGVILMAFLALFLGSWVAASLFAQDPAWFYTFVPGELAGERGPGASTETLRAGLFSTEANLIGQLGVFAASLFSHNTRVALFSFALGVFACVPSLLLTIYNGLILGAFWGLYADRGLALELFGWLSIHGVTELSALALAAAGGFRLGLALLFPGSMTRKDSLRMASKDAVKLALIASLMLLVAGLLEGFARQLVTDTTLRILIGWGIGVLWLAWFLLARRRTG